MNTKELFEQITDALVNDGYIIIQDALPQDIIATLQTTAREQTNYKQASISATSNTHIDTNKRRDKTKWLDENNASEYLLLMKELQEYLNQSLYLGLSYYEAHFALYEKGDFYEKHLDSFRGNKNRVVTTVYYLNEEYEDGDGGELIIYDKDSKEIQRVVPKANTLVVFLSEEFPHEVLKAKKERYSIAGWFRVDKPLF